MTPGLRNAKQVKNLNDLAITNLLAQPVVMYLEELSKMQSFTPRGHNFYFC